MNAAAHRYRCPWCSSRNNAIGAEWRLCATAQRTLVCASCASAVPEALAS
jgi:hypothetical protein